MTFQYRGFRRPRSWRPHAFAGLVLSASAWAQQTVPPPPPPPPPDLPEATRIAAEPPVVMEAFTVDTARDRGYIAVDSLAGGRSNTPIKLTPSAMSSLTRTFIEDVGINNVRDALRWSPNVVPSDYGAGKASPFNAWDFNFRGAGQSVQGGAGPTRNYFTFYQVADSYNVERIEFDRGPNSILFGVGTVGGVLSTYTKSPRLDRDITQVTLQADSEGSLRGEFDTNVLLQDQRLAVRLNAVEDQSEGWRDNDENEFRAADLAVLFKPTDRTTIRVEGEVARAKRTIVPHSYGESISLWDGTTVAPTWGTELSTADPQNEPGAPGVRRMTGFSDDTLNLWVAGQPELGLQNWAQGYSSAGTFLRVAPGEGYYPDMITRRDADNAHPDATRLPVLPNREFTFSAADGVARPEYENITAWLDQRVTENIDAQVSVYRYTDELTAQNYEPISGYAIDLNEQLPNGAPNPNFGKIFGDFFASRQRQERTVSEGRAQVNFRFDTELAGVPIKQLFSVAAGKQQITWGARQNMAQVQNRPDRTAAQNLVWVRLYEDSPNATVALPDEVDGNTIAYAPWSSNWFDFDEESSLENISVVSHTRLWNDRLSVLVGARHDSFDYERIDAFTGDRLSSATDGNTYSAGAIYYLGWLGVFGNYSQNFDPIGPGRAPTLDGSAHEAATGEGVEYGLRVSTNDGRYYASASRYESSSEGRITGTKIGFGNIWRNYFLATGQAEDTTLTRLQYDDTEDLDMSGYELEVTANPTESLRLQLSFAKPESEIVNAMPGQRGYYAANFATWDAAADGSSTAADDLRRDLTNARNLLDQNTAGKTKSGLVDYTASLFANYSFLEGPLAGFSIGGGAAKTGKQYVSTIQNVDYFADSRLSTNLVLAYEYTFGNVLARFSLNVENVLGDEDYYVTSYDGSWVDGAGRPIPSGYNLEAPRLYRLTARFSF